MTLPLIGAPDWQDPLHASTLQTDTNFTNINAGAQFVTTVYDMRAYQSTSIIMSALSNVDPKTNWGQVEIQVTWWANSVGSQIVYQERYPIFPQGSLGAFATDKGRVMLKGPVMGPYMSITATNSGPDQISFTWRVLGNTKVTTQRNIINTDISGHTSFDFDTGVVAGAAIGLAAAGVANTTWPINPGLMEVTISATAQPWVISLLTPQGNLIQNYHMVVVGDANTQFILPRTAVRVQMNNNSGGVSSLTISGASANGFL